MAGGLESLSIAFYEEDDLGDDRVWDRWRIEGALVLFGTTEAHRMYTLWVNIGEPS